MPRTVTISKPDGPIRTSVRLPRSKSVANRALVLASLVGDLGCVKDPGEADDTRVLARLLAERPELMHCGAGGTTFRFLLAWACVQEGEERILTGDARLLERPHAPLIDALRRLGADIEPVAEGYRVRGRQLSGGAITFDSPISSQFISAILLIAPTFSQELYLRWTGQRLSEPYVGMTLRMLAHFGSIPRMEMDGVRIVPAHLKATSFIVPPDWSAAAFWFEVVALAGDAEVELVDLKRDGWQGDQAICSLMDAMVSNEARPSGMLLQGRMEPQNDSVRIDLTDTPDLFQPMAFAYAMSPVRWCFTGLHNLAVKESDRVAVVVEALKRFGIPSKSTGDTCQLSASARSTDRSQGHVFDPHGDHRMAMALAPLALLHERITIADPEVVNKSYPGFWDDLRAAGFGVEYHG